MQRKITNNDLKFIFGDGYARFEEKVIPNCYCGNCKTGNSKIVNYEAYINELNDVVLKGSCGTCGNPMSRYLQIYQICSCNHIQAY